MLATSPEPVNDDTTSVTLGPLARALSTRSSSDIPKSSIAVADTNPTHRPSADSKRVLAAAEPGHRFLHSRFSSLSRTKAKKRQDHQKPPLVRIHIGADQRPVSVLAHTDDGDPPPSPGFEDLDNLVQAASIRSAQSRPTTSSSQSPPPTAVASAANFSHPSPNVSVNKSRDQSPAPSAVSNQHLGIDSRWGSPVAEPSPPTKALEEQKSCNMHQTSSRLLRMTHDERPFTRDFKDLFSTLMVSLPLSQHRVHFSRVEHTFTSEEAMTNLGSLKFSQSNRMPDPKDSSRIVTTTTTTTFSMARDMAKSVCLKFLEARFVESLEGKTDFNSKGSVWQLTPKGMRVLTRFCTRNGIRQRHINDVLDSPRNSLQMVILEREVDTDKLIADRAMMEVILRRFAGDQPNIKSSASSSDGDSINEYATGLVGVRVMKSRKPLDKDSPYIFTGKSATDWLMDCCMVVDRRETLEIARLFIEHGFITTYDDKTVASAEFSATKSAQYKFSEKAMRLLGWAQSPSASVTDAPTPKLSQGRDSNNNRAAVILSDSALRLLFREYLIETHCEENLTFWVDVADFLDEYRRAKDARSPAAMDLIRETLATAYGLYNAFLAPGSPCELNIDHTLRNALAGRMTKAVAQDTEMYESLDEVALLFDQARTSVFKLMASDSVPKFSRDPKYATVLRDRNLDHLLQQNA